MPADRREIVAAAAAEGEAQRLWGRIKEHRQRLRERLGRARRQAFARVPVLLAAAAGNGWRGNNGHRWGVFQGSQTMLNTTAPLPASRWTAAAAPSIHSVPPLTTVCVLRLNASALRTASVPALTSVEPL